MGIIDRAFYSAKNALWNPVNKSNPLPAFSTRSLIGGNLPVKQSKEAYLRYYNEIAWLRAAVSLIAQSVALSEWRLFRQIKSGDREEITEPHPLKDLLNRPNPHQSGHEFLELHQTFDELLGENYWIKQRDTGKPELWLAPPQYMSIIPDATKYIGGYTFKRGDYSKTFKPDEVICFLTPNPMDMLTGSGRVSAVGIDIENESYSGQHIRNFFYWGADPGTVITYPVEANITPDELDRLSEQWAAGHRSYGRAHRAAILTQGATVAKEGMTVKDMDFVNLRKYDRDAILGVFGVSYSMVGGTETVNRANAEAQLINFARWVVTPRLVRIREKLNMFLVPDFGEGLELDFDNPVPDDEAQKSINIDNHVRTGVMSVEEARQELRLGDIELKHHFFIPISTQIVSGQEMLQEQVKPPAEIPPVEIPAKGISDPKVRKYSESWAEAFWKAYVKQAEAYEPKMIATLRKMFSGQESKSLENLKIAVDRNHKLIDKVESEKAYEKAVTPILTEVILKAVENGLDLIKPKNPHKQEIPSIVNKRALDWLKTRIGWVATEMTLETETMLSDALIAGFNAGESVIQIANRVRDVFDNCSSVRALRIARTEIISASSQGALEGYREAGLGKVEFYTAQDELACPACETFNKEVFSLGEEIPIPLHPNCRCVYLPILPD